MSSASDKILMGLQELLGLEPDEDDEDIKTVYPSSTAIDEIAYEEGSQQLHVTYVGGRSYTYFPVSRQKFIAFRDAASKGRFINYNIKPKYFYIPF
jgi:hypothetical protein